MSAPSHPADVVLNEAERRLAIYIGKARYAQCREWGVTNTMFRQSEEGQTEEESEAAAEKARMEMEIDSVGAEIAWCKANNYYPDLTTDRKPNNEDAITRACVAVDVKHTVRRDGRLLVTKKKKVGAVDVYCLMVGSIPRYRCIGYMAAEELLQDSRIASRGYPGNEPYSADQDELEPTPEDALAKADRPW